MVFKHSVLPWQLPLVEQTILFGAAFEDGENHVTFMHFDEHLCNRWFKATVKFVPAKSELWVATFHPISSKEEIRKRKKMKILRDYK